MVEVTSFCPYTVTDFLKAFITRSCGCFFGMRWGDFIAAALLAENGFKGHLIPLGPNASVIKGVNGWLRSCDKLVFIGAPPPRTSWLSSRCSEAVAISTDESGCGVVVLFKGGETIGFYRFGNVYMGSAHIVSKIFNVNIPPKLASFTRSLESALMMFPPPKSLLRDVRFAGLSSLAQCIEWRFKASEGLRGVEEVLEIMKRIGRRVMTGGLNTVRIVDEFPTNAGRRQGDKAYIVVGDESVKIVSNGLAARPAMYGAALTTAKLVENEETAYVMVLFEENGIVKTLIAVPGPAARYGPDKLLTLLNKYFKVPGRMRVRRRIPQVLAAPTHAPLLKIGLPLNITIKALHRLLKVGMQE